MSSRLSLLHASLIGAATADYVVYTGATAYAGHGGTEIDSEATAPTGLSVSDCEGRCDADSTCDCVSQRLSDGKCWKRGDCIPAEFGQDGRFNTYVKGSAPAPTPGPVGPTDLTVQWGGTDGHKACNGPAVQGSDVVHFLGGNDIQLTTDTSPAGGCVFSVAEPKIDLDEFSQIEVDVETSGNREAYGDKAGQWFSLWLYPPGYAYSHGIGESGEIDLVENLPHVRTNFAGCSHDCHETEWSQPSNGVKAHVTMRYDRAAQLVTVNTCEHGADTCPSSAAGAFVDLSKMQVQKPFIYTLCIDVWYAQPGMNFEFSATNLRILRDTSIALNSSLAIV